MTVEAFTPASPATVAGIGPYAVPHPYTAGSLSVVVVQAGSRTTLGAADWAATPLDSATAGNVYLTPAAAALWAGATLYVERATQAEQGWQGVQGEREKGLEAQLDRLAMLAQDAQQGLGTALRLGVAIPMIVPGLNRTLIWDGTGIVAGPTVAQIEAAAAAAAAAAGSASAAAGSAGTAAAAAAAAAASAALLGAWRGPWAGPGTVYAAGDRVSNAGSSYYATVAHTSAALFPTDLSAARWGILAEKGVAGVGAGDVVSTNNGSDFANKPATLANLGGQPVDPTLTALAGLDAGAGVVVQTGADTFAKRSLAGTANQIAIANGDGAAGNPTLSLVLPDQPTAEAGADAERPMSALRVTQLIEARRGASPRIVTSLTVNADVTGLPVGVRLIRLSFDAITLSTNDSFLIQLGTTVGILATGYDSGSGGRFGESFRSDGMLVLNGLAGRALTGHMLLTREDAVSNRWIQSHNVSPNLASNDAMRSGGGSVTLPGAVTQVRLLRIGAGFFTGGAFRLTWEK